MSKSKIILAVKSAPEKHIFKDIRRAGIKAVELYLSRAILKNPREIVSLCKDFPFRYALHAPNDAHMPKEAASLADSLGVNAVVFHDIFWEDEWREVAAVFGKNTAKICIENTGNIHEPLKFIRRYGMKRCLDLEHLQMQCNGMFADEFLAIIRQTAHVHLTGYVAGSNLWHTHIHYSPGHNRVLLGLLRQGSYNGMVVSEASIPLQTYDEFCKLKDFFNDWERFK